MNSGIILIDKPIDFTSRDIVNIMCKKLGTKKVGHCGTLDPLASGVLVICFGNATKLVPYLTASSKTYLTKMILGKQTTTGDLAGEVVNQVDVNVSDEEIISVFNNFPKSYIQEVPIYSAVKVDGKRLYEYAREGLDVTLPKREVEIECLNLININRSNGIIEIEFECEVSKGTYIRSLCNDIAKALKTISVMSSLVRSKQGMYHLSDCSDVDNYTIIDINDIKFTQVCYEVTDEELEDVKNGRKLVNDNGFAGEVLLYYNNELLAVYEASEGFLKSKRGIKVWK